MAQILNRFIVVNFLVAIFLLLLLARSVSYADDGSAALIIEGYIAERLEVDMQSTSQALDLDFSAKNRVTIGSITYYSNSSSGYKITLKSANYGLMLHEHGAQVGAIRYRSFFNGHLLSQSALASEEGVNIVNQPRAVAERGSGSLTIQFEGLDSSAIPAGTYHDVLTAVISAQ